MIANTFDLDYVRGQFPAFAEPELAGQSHFDNAGGSYACRQVIERLTHFYRASKVQPYGAHPVSRRAGEQMDQSHRRLAGYLGIEEDELHFGPSTSQNTYVLAQAVLNVLEPGDEIVVTNQDHEANSGVWRRLRKQGIVVREWQVNPQTGSLTLEALEPLLSERTKLVAFTHCSNILGEINPVAAICARVHAAGARAVVDGVSYAGHGLPDIRALGADIYLFSLYKVYGPHLGVMAISRESMEWLGNQGHYFNEAYLHKWFVPAGPDHAQVAAACGVAEYFDGLHRHHCPTSAVHNRAEDLRSLLRAAELKNLRHLLAYCCGEERLRILGPIDAQKRAATLSLLPLTATPRELANRLAERGMIVGAGHFYAVRLLNAMGLDPETGVLRLSFVHYTSESEIEQLIAALKRVL